MVYEYGTMLPAGLTTFAWILNDPEEWRQAWDLGVDGVMTDFVPAYEAWAQGRQ